MKLIISLGKVDDFYEYYYGLLIEKHKTNTHGSIDVTIEEQTISVPSHVWNNPRIINDDEWSHGRGEQLAGQQKRIDAFKKRLDKYETIEELTEILNEETMRIRLATRKLNEITELPNKELGK